MEIFMSSDCPIRLKGRYKKLIYKKIKVSFNTNIQVNY